MRPKRRHSIRSRQFVALSVSIILSLPGLAQQRSSVDEDLVRREAHRYQVWARAMSAGPTAGQGMDVTSYALDLDVSGPRGTLRGSVRTDARITGSSVTSLSVDCSAAIIVDSVRLEGTPAVFTHAGQTLVITLPRAYLNGERLSWTAYYHGTPASTGFGSYTDSLRLNGTRWVYTLSEPYGAREWWPCVDHPTDKADSVDIRITCPSGNVAVANGTLQDSTQNGNGTTSFHWKHRYPIAAYLVSMNVAPFSTFADWYRRSAADSMRIINYVQPDLFARRPTARAAAGLTPRMLEVFEELFGPYPFRAEGYGHVEFGWSGGMEHQTLTSLGWAAFNEGTIAHELAHQWFGDLITCRTWPDLWLNEGFATYGDALFRERQYGRTTFLQNMVGKSNSARSAAGSLYVQDTASIGNLFASSRVYNKGAWVLHMLRRVVGDSTFFRALRAYASDPALRFGTASTADFRGHLEAVSGQDLRYFFDQWVFGERYPAYTYALGIVSSGAESIATVRVRQSTGTTNPVLFRMPIDLRFMGPAIDTIVTVWNDTSDQTWQIVLRGAVDSVTLDPDQWILKTAVRVPMSGIMDPLIPGTIDLSTNFPNPFNATTWLRVDLPEQSHVLVEVFDLAGRRMAVLADQVMAAGMHEVPWRSEAPSGIYLCRLVATTRFDSRIVARKMVLLR